MRVPDHRTLGVCLGGLGEVVGIFIMFGASTYTDTIGGAFLILSGSVIAIVSVLEWGVES